MVAFCDEHQQLEPCSTCAARIRAKTMVAFCEEHGMIEPCTVCTRRFSTAMVDYSDPDNWCGIHSRFYPCTMCCPDIERVQFHRKAEVNFEDVTKANLSEDERHILLSRVAPLSRLAQKIIDHYNLTRLSDRRLDKLFCLVKRKVEKMKTENTEKIPSSVMNKLIEMHTFISEDIEVVVPVEIHVNVTLAWITGQEVYTEGAVNEKEVENKVENNPIVQQAEKDFKKNIDQYFDEVKKVAEKYEINPSELSDVVNDLSKEVYREEMDV